MATSQVMRITLKAYDHQLVDASAKKNHRKCKKERNKGERKGTNDNKEKRSEQFEQRTHKRLIDIVAPTQKTVDALSRLEMPAGVYIDIKMKNK